MIFIGSAGWAIRKVDCSLFPGEGTHLERYARQFNAVEINSSFYRPHQRVTYIKWAKAVPQSFRFSVKVPKQITHEQLLEKCDLVQADPVIFRAASLTSRAVAYFRLHGSPQIYYSNYEPVALLDFSVQMARASHSASAVWCLFDNTAGGFATTNAFEMQNLCGNHV